VDDEAVQVLVGPAERGLQGRMQVGDGGGRHEQPPPDQRADPAQHDP